MTDPIFNRIDPRNDHRRGTSILIDEAAIREQEHQRYIDEIRVVQGKLEATKASLNRALSALVLASEFITRAPVDRTIAETMQLISLIAAILPGREP